MPSFVPVDNWNQLKRGFPWDENRAESSQAAEYLIFLKGLVSRNLRNCIAQGPLLSISPPQFPMHLSGKPDLSFKFPSDLLFSLPRAIIELKKPSTFITGYKQACAYLLLLDVLTPHHVVVFLSDLVNQHILLYIRALPASSSSSTRLLSLTQCQLSSFTDFVSCLFNMQTLITSALLNISKIRQGIVVFALIRLMCCLFRSCS